MTVVAVVISVMCLHLALEYLYRKVKVQCRQRSSTAVLYVNRGNKESEEEECGLLSSDNEHDTLIFLNNQLIRENGNSNNSAAVVSLDAAETSQSDVPIIVSSERTDAIVSLDAETSQSNVSIVTQEQSDDDNDSDHGNETSALLQS